MYSIDQGQLTDIRKLTREEHRMLKTMDIPKASEDTLRVANKLLETVSRLLTSVKLRFLGPNRNKVPVIQTLAAKSFELDLLIVKRDPNAFDFNSLVKLMDYDREVVPSLMYPSPTLIQTQYSLFKARVIELLTESDYLVKNNKIDQLKLYGDLIREALSSTEESPFKTIFTPLCRAMTRLGVEAITESMGSLLKLQYKVNMNIETAARDPNSLPLS